MSAAIVTLSDPKIRGKMVSVPQWYSAGGKLSFDQNTGAGVVAGLFQPQHVWCMLRFYVVAPVTWVMI